MKEIFYDIEPPEYGSVYFSENILYSFCFILIASILYYSYSYFLKKNRKESSLNWHLKQLKKAIIDLDSFKYSNKVDVDRVVSKTLYHPMVLLPVLTGKSDFIEAQGLTKSNKDLNLLLKSTSNKELIEIISNIKDINNLRYSGIENINFEDITVTLKTILMKCDNLLSERIEILGRQDSE